MSPDLIDYLPRNWAGAFAGIMFTIFIVAQVIEKFEPLARFVPGGMWWFDRKRKQQSLRKFRIEDDNDIIRALQEQVRSIVADLASVRDELRTFTAWSIYDARWHHQSDIHLSRSGTPLPEHLDFFAFEALWKLDPLVAAKLPSIL